MNKSIVKQQKRESRHKKIRAKVSGSIERPRVSVFKSNKYLYAQLIDDNTGKTLLSSSGLKVKAATKTEQAKAVGSDLAKQAKAQKIEKVVFDRGGYIYTGRVKALAEALREGGLVF